MLYTFLSQELPMAKYRNGAVIIVTKEDTKSLAIDEHGDYITVENDLLKPITKEEVIKKLNNSSLFTDICREEGVIEVREEENSYESYALNN